ncbi:MAG: hypothetical protein NT062_25720, partial [Proteobacteria bacterium]|nr:hypothetical protein [Pseudomonadota bacterium]
MIVWILALVGIAQAVLATRAYLLEKREGLPRSTRRFVGAAVVAVLLVALGVVAMMQRFSGPTAAPVAPVAEAPKPSPEAQARIVALAKEIGALDHQVLAKRADVAKLDPSSV